MRGNPHNTAPNSNKRLRWLALSAMLALLAPMLVLADAESVPVVTRIAGSLTVRPASGAPHDVGLLQTLRSGDTVITGLDSSSELSLEGVANIRLASGTVAQVFAPQTGLSVRLNAGTMCVDSSALSLAIATNGVTMSPQQTPTTFDISVDANGTKIGVVDGTVAAVSKPGRSTLHADDGLLVDNQGIPTRVALATISGAFANCGQTLARRESTPAPSSQPAPTAGSPPPGGGGGGGGGGFIGTLLALLAVGAAAAGHGGGGGGGSSATPPPTPPPSPSPSPSQSPPPGPLKTDKSRLSFTDVGSANSQQFIASESNYSGAINESDNCSGVASVSPGAGTSPATFTVTPAVSAQGGSCTVIVTDDHGGSVPVSVIVGHFGAVVPSPNTFSFVGTGQTENFTVSETNYTGPFSAADSSANPCSSAGIATISLVGGATYMVTSQGAGNCALVISDDHTQNSEVTVFVATGSLTVSPNEIQFPDITAAPSPAPFTASDPNNGQGGTYNPVSSNPTVATATCDPPCKGTSAQITVTPLTDGQTTITVADSVSGSQAEVSIGVGTSPLVQHKKHHPSKGKPTPAPSPRAAPPKPKPLPNQPPGGPQQSGALTVDSSFVALSELGETRSVGVSQRGYFGSIAIASSNVRVAAVTAVAAGPHRWALLIAARGAGIAVITVSDALGRSQAISVRVFAPPKLKVR